MYRGVKTMRGHGQHLRPTAGSSHPVHPTTGVSLNPHTLEPHQHQALDHPSGITVPSMGPYEQPMMQTKLPKAPKGIGLPRLPRAGRF